MRRDDLAAGATGGADANGQSDELPRSLATAALLGDAVRRRIFRFVRRARRPVTRDEAAASARVSRNLAAFHLDRLVQAGLLRASDRSPTDVPRVGRRPKVYEAGPVEVHLDMPQRQHGLLASVLLETLAAQDESAGVRRAAIEAAGRRGGELGRAALEHGGDRGGAGARAVLGRLGFDPYDSGPSAMRLGNCPFHPLTAESRELVCGLNIALIEGLLRGIEAKGAQAVLAPRSGECCVEIRAAPAPG